MKHYTGPLDFIGLPGYSIDENGNIYRSETGVRKVVSDDHCICVRIKAFEYKKRHFSVRKLQWCADHSIHYDKVRGSDIAVGSDGKIRTCKDHLEYIRNKKAQQLLSTMPIEEQLQRIDEAMSDMQMLREAVTSGDYSKVAKKVADLYRPIYAGIHKRYHLGARVRFDDIRTETFDVTMQQIKKGYMIAIPLGLHLHIVTRNIALLLQHQVKKRKKAALFELENLHNPDDEMPYQYD